MPPAALWLTLFWFGLTYLGLALGRLPWLRTDRAGVAFENHTDVVERHEALAVCEGVIPEEAADVPTNDAVGQLGAGQLDHLPSD